MSQTDIIHGDRRANRRYAYLLALRFSYADRGVTYAGTGCTLDLSRWGIRFDTETPPPVGAFVELRVQWPFLLQNVCPLELNVWGRVQRTDADGTVVRITRYEFRTCGARAFHQPEDGHSIYSIVA